MSFNGKMNSTEYLIDSLAMFYADPADTDYQQGYFDALAYMADYLGVISIDDIPHKPSRPKFTVIQGGRVDDPAPPEVKLD